MIPDGNSDLQKEIKSSENGKCENIYKKYLICILTSRKSYKSLKQT